MTRRARSPKNLDGDEKATGKDSSSRASVGYRDLIVIIAAGSGLVMNVMVGQIYAAPWWIRLAFGLLIFGIMLVSLQLLRGFLRWCLRLLRG